MFPYRDENPTTLRPIVTVGIIVVNVLAWVLVQGAGSGSDVVRSVCELGLIPGEFLHRVPVGTAVPLAPGMSCVLGASATWFTPLTSMFLHGGWFHLIGNLWFLWIFGNNIEDSMGHTRFLIFYLLGGLVAAAVQVAVQPASTIPMVGASGAISGVLGAYIMLFPRVRVHVLFFLGFFFFSRPLPAWVILGYWFVLQVLGGLPSLGRETGGVAFWAHVGGFGAGMLLIGLFKNPMLLARRPAGWWQVQ